MRLPLTTTWLVALVLLSLLALSFMGMGRYLSSPVPPLEAAGAGFLTYPFRWSSEMRLLCGWKYADGTYHGGADFVKGLPGYRNTWQSFDVLAAAPGDACWQWGAGNDPGRVIKIEHQVNGITYETRYLHLYAVESYIPPCPSSVGVARGGKIGVAGDKSWVGRCAPPCVHLHFELRQKGQLIDPYDLYSLVYRYPQPTGKQAGLMGGGARWTADPPVCPDDDKVPPVISFRAPVPNRWYPTDEQVSWWITDVGGTGVRGFNLACDRDPGGLPAIDRGSGGTRHFSELGPGIHTLTVRAWDLIGNEAFASQGWFGYDPNPPTAPVAATEGHGVTSDLPQSTISDPDFTWGGAQDAGSGIAGYNVYWGTDPAGAAANWAAEGGYNPGPVRPGVYYLRVRTCDIAGNTSPWATLFVFRYAPSQ